MAKGDALDRKGLIEEAYKVDGITAAECRSIFLDWALSFDGDVSRNEQIALAISFDHRVCRSWWMRFGGFNLINGDVTWPR